MSLQHGLDPKIHLEAGRVLAPLRDEGVLIIGSGMSYHNMRGYGDPRSLRASEQFDTWLTESVLLDGDKRREQLSVWETAPAARASHPHAEHLLPLMVAAGASDGPGHKIYSETVLGVVISGFRFD